MCVCVCVCVCVSPQVLNIVHGSHDVVNAILDHPDIKAISFVGSDKAGRYIYKVRIMCVCVCARACCVCVCARVLRGCAQRAFFLPRGGVGYGWRWV